MRASFRTIASMAALFAAGLVSGTCAAHETAQRDADVVVIGAGIAGLGAALEASDGGARVVVLDANSVGGGHAVLASGFSLVGTPLQEKNGFRDDPELAIRDIMAWGEDADEYWVRRYVEASRTEVHDWLTAKGVEFAMILPSAEDSVPRFHLTRGGAVNAVLPMLREALSRESITFVWNREATRLLHDTGGIAGVVTRDLRTGRSTTLRAPAVVLATGGFESNDEMVRAHWPAGRAVPAPLYVGSGEFATGSGIGLATAAGAALTRMDRQLVYVTGLPNPRDPSGRRGLLVLNPAAIMVDDHGRRFVNESAPSKAIESLVLSRSPPAYWLLFDAAGRSQLMIRGGPWLNSQTIATEIMDNPRLVKRADSIGALALAAGLPADALINTVERYNGFVARGSDEDFGHFGPGVSGRPAASLTGPPFYAIRLYPMTRKSMGGIVIDHDTRALDRDQRPITGLYAAGEVTGIASINGSHGGSGTFLGPSLLIGRIAGRAAAAQIALTQERQHDAPATGLLPDEPPARADTRALALRIQQEAPGFWHFTQAHRLVVERQEQCATCHSAAWPPGPAIGRTQRLAQLDSCKRCH